MLFKCLHITLIFSLLTSSVGVVLNQHFCQDELKEVSLYKAVENCHESSTKKQKTCPHHPPPAKSNGMDADDCCHDTSDYLKAQQEQQLQMDVLPDLLIASCLPPIAKWASTTLTTSELSGKYYRPPPLPKDIPALFQIYRL